MKAKEDADAALIEEAKRKRREEKEARKREKAEAKARALEDARLAAEASVLADIWTQEQQCAFEAALLENPPGPNVDKGERWLNMATAVEGKSRNQCIARYKFLKEFIKKQAARAADDS